jgi:hypothetical protein
MKRRIASIFHFKKLPHAALISVLLIAAFEVFIRLNESHFTGAFNAIVLERKKTLGNPDIQHDIVILGDSRYYSLRPDLVEKRLKGNLRVGNYSWPFEGIEAYEYMLDAILKYKKPPQVIIASLPPDYFAVPEKNLTYAQSGIYRIRMFNVFPDFFILGKAIKERSRPLLWDLILYKITPLSSRYRNKVPGVLFNLLRFKTWPPADDDEYRILEQEKQYASFLLFDDDRATSQAWNRYEKAYAPIAPYHHSSILGRYERFLEKAKNRHIPVILFNTPLLEDQYRTFKDMGILESYETQVREWTRAFPNFQYIEPYLYTYPYPLFADAGHLNLEGDGQFREFYPFALAEKINSLSSQ